MAELGPIGPAELGGDRHYTHTQVSAASTWAVTHNLGKLPAVTIVDSAGTQVIGDVEYVDDDNLIITFAAPFGGRAFCN